MKGSQKGFSVIVLLVIIVILILVVVGGFLFLGAKGKLPASVNIPQVPGINQKVSEKEFEFIKDPNVRKHYATQANQQTYQQKVTSSFKSGFTINEFHRSGIDVNSRNIENDGTKETAQMITIADTIYVKDYTDNKWWKQTIKPEEIKEEKEEDVIDVQEEYSQSMELDISHKFLGMEACGNLNCFKYEETYTSQPDMKRIFWFDDKKYLLRREEFGFAGVKTVNEYSYDGINIKAPSPTKEVPEGKSIYDYYYVGASASQPSQEEIERMQEQFQIPSEPPLENESFEE